MKLKSIHNYNVILLMIPAIYTGFYPGEIIVITALCFYPILYILWQYNYRLENVELSSTNIIKFYMYVNIIIFLRGLIDLNTTQDISVTFGNMIFTTLLFPMYIFVIQRKNFIGIFKSIVWFAIPLSLISFFFPPTNGFMSFQHNISIVYLFIFFIPFVSKKWKLTIISLAIIGLTYDLTRRSFSINLLIATIILSWYYILSNRSFIVLSKIFFYIFIFSPLIFLSFGLIGVYNIFKIGEVYENIIVQGKSNSRNIFVDSRTSIYTDVFNGLKDNDAFIFGLGGNGKVKTSLVDAAHGNFSIIYKEGRRGSESGMLNYIQWGGFVASFSYWLLLSMASYNAIYKSRNSLIQMLGFFMAFKVLYSFIEDTISVQIASFYLMFMIGLCYNKYIRNFENSEVLVLSRKIFTIK